MLVAAGPDVTIATPGRPVAWAKPSAMWPAPCSWRTRMCRIGESMIGSYTGRMAPPGRPKMTSTPSISRALIRAWPPFIFPFVLISGSLLSKAENEIDLPIREVEVRTQAKWSGRALQEYYEVRSAGCRHRRKDATFSPPRQPDSSSDAAPALEEDER